MRAFLLMCFVAAVTAQYHYPHPTQVNKDSVNNEELSLPIQPIAEEYNKAFYSYSAPEQEFDDLNAGEHIANALKKNLRVIFIKGPDNSGLENAALQLAKGASDDRTAIYVLSQQSDISALANQVQQIKSSNTVKPEVHFVKYRTQADAENAQRTIQAQYDTLPGVTSNNDPSSAPVLDFASKSTSSSATNNVSASAPVAAATSAPSRGFSSTRGAYLPPSKRF